MSKKNDFIPPNDKEEVKVMQRKNSADYLLSQDSIKQYEVDAEQETKNERERLDHLNKQKRELAKMLKEKQDKEFRQKQDQTKSDRLKFLLKQSEIFTHFILQKQKANNIDDNQLNKALVSTSTKDRKKDIGGKTSVSKRHQKKGKQV